MKKVMIGSLLALAFATGFTCSKHTPEATETPAAPQEQMATPPAEGQPAAPAEGAAAPAPTEAAPAEGGH